MAWYNSISTVLPLSITDTNWGRWPISCLPTPRSLSSISVVIANATDPLDNSIRADVVADYQDYGELGCHDEVLRNKRCRRYKLFVILNGKTHRMSSSFIKCRTLHLPLPS